MQKAMASPSPFSIDAAEEPCGPRVPPRVALLSIAGFWLFYFAVISVRSLAVGFSSQLNMLLPRAAVTLVGMALTYLMYRALAALPRATLRRSIFAAALLALPASILYASANWFAFSFVALSAMDKRMKGGSSTVVIRTGVPGQVPTVEVVPDPADRRGGVPAPPAAPAPPVAPGADTTVITVGGDPHRDDGLTVTAIADSSANGYFFFVAWAALYLALCYAAETREAERRAARFRAAAQSAELRALRYQVNPHFLFNTLNSLSSLVMVDRREEAERMILNLSTFFRTSLTADPAEDLPLFEEIRLQRLYLDIERVRFPDRLQVDIDIPDPLRTACVPALILQPLIENAIKYGVARSRRPVTIRIDAAERHGRLRLTVTDDGAGDGQASATDGGIGVGLRNVHDRLAARFGQEATCRWGVLPEGGFAVTLEMPVVRNGC